MANITIFGAGSWGTALGALLCDNGHAVTLWAHRQETAEEINVQHTNASKLPGAVLPEHLRCTSDLEQAARDADLYVFAVPSTATRKTAEQLKGMLPDGAQVVCVSKGIEEGSLLLQSQILEEVLESGVSVGVLSGPSHAEEVIRRLPTVVVAGSAERRLAVFTQEIFMNSNFRVYTSPDICGIEIGASLKNVIALAAGMLDGIGFGDNARAALITRGIKEISELAIRMGGRPETLAGLTGMGDLIVTCSSVHSRNHQAGVLLGQGKTLAEAVEEVHMVVEGVNSAKAALALGEKYGLELPIVRSVCAVLFDGKAAKEETKELMLRDKKSEWAGLSW